MTAVIKPVATVETTAENEVQDIGFLHAGLIQCGLPRNAVDGREFVRTNGNRMLIIRAGELGIARAPQPVPYGVLPRLLMVYICTKAAEGKYKQTLIDLDNSANAFLGQLGVSVSGQARKNLRIQINALAACQIAFVTGDGVATRESFLRPVRDLSSFEAIENGNADTWPRDLVLSLDFLEALKGNAVPLDYGALAKLKGSALALDAYAWMAYKLPYMTHADEYISWSALKGQFGHEYASLEDFTREMKGAIVKALAVYPGARAEFPRGRVRLFRSPPPVARKVIAGGIVAPVAPAAAPQGGMPVAASAAPSRRPVHSLRDAPQAAEDTRTPEERAKIAERMKALRKSLRGGPNVIN